MSYGEDPQGFPPDRVARSMFQTAAVLIDREAAQGAGALTGGEQEISFWVQSEGARRFFRRMLARRRQITGRRRQAPDQG